MTESSDVLNEGSLVFLPENPSLGPGRLVPARRGTGWQVLMLESGATHACRAEMPPAPYPLPAGRAVQILEDGDLSGCVGEVVRQVAAPDGKRRRFAVVAEGIEVELDELLLAPLPAGEDLAARTLALSWDRPTDFFARRSLLQQLKMAYEDAEGLPTLVGARVRSFAHQVYAVRRVLWARTPRFVLADEVGLGKTIEAGLVLQALLAADPDLSVLVVAPGSMTRQWLCEVYLRLGARAFSIVKNLKDPIGPRSIVSTTLLNRQKRSWERLAERRWGMVIIDEAHQHPPGSRLYKLYRELAQNSDGLLVLSATPSKRETSGILGLLSLVAPERYSPDDQERLERLLEARREVWDKLDYQQQLREAPDFADIGAEELGEIADDWQPLLEGDTTAQGLLTRLRKGDVDAFDELQAYVEEHYRVDHRIIRTRRKTVEALGKKWCERRLEEVSYDPTPEESLLVKHVEDWVPEVAGLDSARRALCMVLLRLLTAAPEQVVSALSARMEALEAGTAESLEDRWWEELLSDPSPEEEHNLIEAILAQVAEAPGERAWLEQAVGLARDWQRSSPRGTRHEKALQWIENHLATHPDQKLLVFAGDRDEAQAFASTLTENLDTKVEAFHWVQTAKEEERLKKITVDFQRSQRRPVLVSDELGGEGRNFQMAEAVLHLQSPWSVARLEQRIGRLDRIGRDADRDVRSVVFVGPSAVEKQVHRTHSQVFGVHERSIGGLEFILPKLQRRIHESAASGAAALESQFDELSSEVDSAFREAEEDFDRSLDTSRIELERAAELVSILSELGGSDWQDPVQYWARALGMKARRMKSPSAQNEFEFKWEGAALRDSLQGIPHADLGDHRYVGTFDRSTALEREGLQYFTPGTAWSMHYWGLSRHRKLGASRSSDGIWELKAEGGSSRLSWSDSRSIPASGRTSPSMRVC